MLAEGSMSVNVLGSSYSGMAAVMLCSDYQQECCCYASSNDK